MSNYVKLACLDEVVVLPLARILPTRIVDKALLRSPKGMCIAASVKELGLIEPLVVFPQADAQGLFVLLDGHTRHAILQNLGEVKCRCLVSTDDEAFTYNHKVNRLSAIQEHFMIRRAIENGVIEADIAKTLNVDVAKIRQKRQLLDGICPEAVVLLRDRRINVGALRELRKVKPMRQIEISELMISSHNFSEDYAKCMVAATSDEQLVDGERNREVHGLTPDELSRMENEMSFLVREFKVIEESHGKNVLNLVVVKGYLRKLLDNARVLRYLAQRQPEILHQFQKLVEARDLQESAD